MKKFNVKTVLCTTVMSLFLTACGGASLKIDKSINKADKNNSSTIKFVNATSDMANFYVRAKGISEGIYSSTYEADSIIEGEVSEAYTYQWNEIFDDTEFAVTDSGTLTKKDKVNYTIENGKAYWSIAWLDNSEYSMSIVDFEGNSDTNSYIVRFFSVTDRDIVLGESDSALVTVVKGEMTASFTFDNCDELDAINNSDSNFCQIANVGQSYIAIIKQNGEVIFGQE